MEDAPNCWKFPSQSVQTFGYVWHSTIGQNHGPVWKTQSFFLNQICEVILWQDYCGKGNSRMFYSSTVGKMFSIENVDSLTEKKRTILISACGRLKIGWHETEHQSDLESTHERRWYWESQHHSSTMFFWVVLKEKVRLARILRIIAKICSIQGSLLEQWNITRNKSHRETWCRNCLFTVLWHGRSCKEIHGNILRLGE